MVTKEFMAQELGEHLKELGGPGSGRRPSGKTEDKRVRSGPVGRRVKAGPRIRRVKAMDTGEEFDIEEYDDEDKS